MARFIGRFGLLDSLTSNDTHGHKGLAKLHLNQTKYLFNSSASTSAIMRECSDLGSGGFPKAPNVRSVNLVALQRPSRCSPNYKANRQLGTRKATWTDERNQKLQTKSEHVQKPVNQGMLDLLAIAGIMRVAKHRWISSSLIARLKLNSPSTSRSEEAQKADLAGFGQHVGMHDSDKILHARPRQTKPR